jgi:catechol 2,3-dioxygenase-like lactoylglutathione lyase family enzyme
MWKALQIYHVNINCTNLERSLAFYEMLGFREVIDIPAGRLPGLGMDPAIGRAKLLRLGEEPRSTLIDLIEWHTPRPHGTPYADLGHTGIARLCLRVKGLAAMVADLESHGVRFISEPVSPGLAGGKQTFVCFYDPDGTVLELMELF